MATIGAGIVIKGRITGTEELKISGQVEGQISLDSALIVEAGAHVTADADAHTITIFGHFSGNIIASDRIILQNQSVVTGNLRAPRIVIEEGARFKGNIDMDVPA